MNLLIIGLNHKTAPLEIREKIAFSSEKIQEALQSLRKLSSIQEAAILSTCNRVEIYAISSEFEKAADELKAFFAEYHSISIKELKAHLYLYFQREAVMHGFRVAAGLDSMILGEPQILGQMKEAYQLACEAGTIQSSLHRYFHQVFRVAKKVRTDTEIGSLPVSISYAAIMLAKKIFGGLENQKVLLVGTGKMGKLALTHLKSQNLSEIWISNRNFDEAKKLSLEFQGHPIHFEDFALSLPQVDIVITSTASEQYILKREMVERVMHLRKNKPMFIIDIAVPRNVDPEINRIYNVYLYDIDDLQSVIEANQKERSNQAQKAEKIILEETHSFIEEWKTRSELPTLHLLAKKLNQIRSNELNKIFDQLKDLTDEQKRIIEASTEAMVRKILHDPSIILKAEKNENSKEFTYTEMIQKLFRLDKIV